jgi:hypothetical protein
MPDNQFWRDASGRLTFEMFRSPSDCYPAVCKAIAARFNLEAEKKSLIVGLDEIYQNYESGGQVVQMAWDNWSGFFVIAMSPASESLVHEIAAWLLQSRWAVHADATGGGK